MGEALQMMQPSAWEVQAVAEPSDFLALQPAWDALWTRTQSPLFHRHDFIRIFLKHFTPHARMRVLTARDEAGTLRAVLPLMDVRAPFYGLPVDQRLATANAHSCRFDLMTDDAEHAGPLFFKHLAGERGWDVLRLTDVPEGGAAWSLYRAARAQGFPGGTWQSLVSPYIQLPSTYEALQQRLSSKFKANLRRRRRKLEEQGEVTFECFTGGEALPERLVEGFALEQSGWKGERGTAMASDAATRGFYIELAGNAAARGELALLFLRVNGRAVAFQYGLVCNGTYLLLKPGYDEALKECSPGQLLMEEALKACVAGGLHEFDFLGPDMVWKRDWTEKARVHTWLFIFRSSPFGKALCRAKFEWVPKAKEVVARWKR